MTEAKETKYDSVITRHRWRASANESNMASQKAGYCVIRILASFAGVAFMRRFARMLFDLYSPCPPDERYLFPARSTASLYQGEGERYAKNKVSDSVLTLASQVCVLSVTERVA